MSIPFIQFLMPDGRKDEVSIDRPEEIEAMAQEVIATGLRFECEMLSNYKTVSLTVANPTAGVDLFMELAPNGPDVLVAVDKLVTDAHAAIAKATP